MDIPHSVDILSLFSTWRFCSSKYFASASWASHDPHTSTAPLPLKVIVASSNITNRARVVARCSELRALLCVRCDGHSMFHEMNSATVLKSRESLEPRMRVINQLVNCVRRLLQSRTTKTQENTQQHDLTYTSLPVRACNT